ncbi:hypothetical protein [Erwinia sp. 198]|uniref:hypothetical protein n=1 Tax=Erwinia sp. 198 TaxID=2022746 RepID=UPI000F67BD1C|nr:hypothetical protein [Erwinia sp. 198]RRZ91570.1 hypothetical protein EGK14_11605 [Erwinia sp. 198]
MDNYLDKNRFKKVYRIQAMGKADALRNIARQAGIRHINSLILRENFNLESGNFIEEQLKSIN